LLDKTAFNLASGRVTPAEQCSHPFAFVQMADAGGMIFEEQIFKVAECITYFLQGLGHSEYFHDTR